VSTETPTPAGPKRSRVEAPSSQSIRAVRREQMRRRRAATRSLRGTYPSVASIRLELQFESSAGWSPAALSHVLYPPAPAFFQFECPYGDCDGDFDLTAIVGKLMADGVAQASGTLQCPGFRAAAGLQRQACGLLAHYRITPFPQGDSTP
jgi:hypothetical protein